VTVKLEDVVRDNTGARMVRAAGAREAILYLPSAFGFNAFVDKQLEELASLGFTALAWNPFHSVPDVPQSERSKYTDTVQQDTLVQKEHVRWLDFLEKECGAERIGTLGFCMGGRMAISLGAADGRVKAAAGFYPTMRDPKPELVIDLPAVAPKVGCPVMVHAPGKDALTPQGNFAKLRTALESRESALTSFNWYPKGSHGFLSKSRQDSPDDYAYGLVAWPATLAFLRAALKPA
jgi:carboxymethylenebutenolidase